MYSLSAADLSIGTTRALPVTLASPFGHWPLGKALCFMNYLGEGTVELITAWSLVALSTEGYIAIIYPLGSSNECVSLLTCRDFEVYFVKPKCIIKIIIHRFVQILMYVMIHPVGE